MAQMYAHGMITPILALVLWSLVMWVWLYATRIPAMAKANVDLNEARMTGALALPPQVRWPADNYNHLMEQPTIFYAAAFAAQLSNAADAINIGLAWAYVTLRVIHSLVQATSNIIMLRFSIFSISSIVLSILAIRTMVLLLS